VGRRAGVERKCISCMCSNSACAVEKHLELDLGQAGQQMRRLRGLESSSESTSPEAGSNGPINVFSSCLTVAERHRCLECSSERVRMTSK